MSVLFGIEKLFDKVAVGHAKQHARIVDERRFARLDVGDEVFGRLAPVFDGVTEFAFPRLEDFVKILLVDLLFDGRLDILIADVLNPRDEIHAVVVSVGKFVNVRIFDGVEVGKVVDKFFTRRTWFQVPIVIISLVKFGEGFGREQRTELFRDDANVLAKRSVVPAEFQSTNVIQSLRDNFCPFAKIFKVGVELELEQNLLRVQVDTLFARRLELHVLGEGEL